jgi:hypothetical protein
MLRFEVPTFKKKLVTFLKLVTDIKSKL